MELPSSVISGSSMFMPRGCGSASPSTARTGSKLAQRLASAPADVANPNRSTKGNIARTEAARTKFFAILFMVLDCSLLMSTATACREESSDYREGSLSGPRRPSVAPSTILLTASSDPTDRVDKRSEERRGGQGGR